MYYCVVLDVFSRKVVGWSIDPAQTATLVTNALGIAISDRGPVPGTLIHSDHRVQYTSWALPSAPRTPTWSPRRASTGSIGDRYDNAVIESFWGRMQVKLLNRQRWHTRIELANAIFEYQEIFHNHRHRHNAPEMPPMEYERMHSAQQPA